MATRDYSSVSSIKKFAIEEIAPKYFNMEKTNDLNIGLLGYTTEIVGSTTEDTFNVISTYLNEIFPHLATIPENIFNHGALFQIDASFATASQCNMILLVPESIVLSSATRVQGTTDLYEFFLDSNMTITVEDIRYKPDYNVKINFKKYRNNTIYTAMYDMTENGTAYSNGISSIVNPYIKLKQINYERVNYLQLEISTHQVDRYELNDNIVDSTIINSPKYTIEYDDYIADFEIMYKSPNSNNYVQMKKLLHGSSPIKDPFCYYKAIDDGKLEITFTSRDNYFQPEYNSEINIIYFTTLGSSANFDEYTGSNISVMPSSDTYDYNNNITLFAIPITGSYGGSDPLSLEQLKAKTVEMYSTVGSYTTESDLQVYFNNFNLDFNSNVLFLKKRDDIFERIFSAFILLKSDSNEIYSTNTLQIRMSIDDFDTEFTQSNTFILNAGHLFKYKTGSNDTLELIPNGTVTNFDNLSLTDEFVYSNPFMIHFSKEPIGVSYYLTTFETKYAVDYSYVNNNSMIQFICNNLTVSRNGVQGSKKYTIKVTITPTTNLDNPMIVETENTDGTVTTTITNSIKLRLNVLNANKTDICYLDMTLDSWDTSLDIYTFKCEIETDDYITGGDRFRVLNMIDSGTTSTNPIASQQLIPMIDAILKVKIDYTYADSDYSESYTVTTNEYVTESHPVTFIKPMYMTRSSSEYSHNGDGTIVQDGTMIGGTYSIVMNSSPFIKATLLSNSSTSKELYNIYQTQYEYIENILDKITNNYTVDLKFYNTYGKSKNFHLQDSPDTLIDKVNMSIKFKIHPTFGTDESELIRDTKIFIKEYIENINNSGTNTFYISNLIKELETNFSEIEYLKFMGINNYTTDVQGIINTSVDLDTLTKKERSLYTPEYLTIRLEDVNIEIF